MRSLTKAFLFPPSGGVINCADIDKVKQSIVHNAESLRIIKFSLDNKYITMKNGYQKLIDERHQQNILSEEYLIDCLLIPILLKLMLIIKASGLPYQ